MGICGIALTLGSVEIFRWNKYEVTTLLPDGYTPVEYIQSSGTQYIDPKVSAKNISKMDTGLIALSNGLSIDPIYGADWSTQGYFLIFYQNNLRFHSNGASVDINNYKVDEKNIIVTKDEQEAQRLITPDFVQKLELVKERFKKVALNVFDGDFFGAMEKDLISSKRIDVSFFENQALFAIYLDVDLFELFDVDYIDGDSMPYEEFYSTIESILKTVHLFER